MGIEMQCIRCKKEIVENSIYCSFCGKKQINEKRTRTRGNGQGSVYKRGNTWECQIQSYLGGVRIVKRKSGFESKKNALSYLETLKIKRKDSKIAELWKIYSENNLPRLSNTKQTAYNIAYKRLSDIYTMKIADIDISILQTCINKNAISYYTARDMKVLLSHFFKMAMAQQEVHVNLSQFIVLPPLDEAEPTPFQDDELTKLWECYENDKTIGYILLMIYSGMMPGELLLCKKEMIDFDNQRIVGCGLKTKQRKKTPIMIADIILPVISDLVHISTTEYLLDMKRNDFYNWFDKKLKILGCRDLTPYACRHTTATALALGNQVAPSVIQKIMRHAKITTTQRYIHPDTSDMLLGINTLKKPN